MPCAAWYVLAAQLVHFEEPSAEVYVPMPHFLQATVDSVEYLPAAHLLHAFAPAVAPAFVTEPAGQVSQSLASSEPVDSTYLPASQSMQAATFDAVEYLPTAQALQVVAPVLVPVSVIDPAVHTVHAATFDAVEYVPAAHAEHKLAPGCAPVLVIEPATHALQWPCPMSSWY